MTPDPEARQKVQLTIFNRTFSLLVSGDPAEIEAAAEQVDQLMIDVARSGNFDTMRVAIVAALQLALRLRTLEQEISQVRTQVDSKTREFSRLLDTIIEEPPPA
jgi:cell division protein ZapA (FtsZ GTPase activity inhibitor)